MEDQIGVNRNVNITQPDPHDNVKRDTHKKPASGFKFTPQLIGQITISTLAYILLWFMAINITNFYCWTRNDYTCGSVDWVHGVFVFGLFALIIIPAIVAIAYGIQVAINAGYIESRGVTLHRRQLQEYTPQLIEVMRTSAASEASAGVDTYSPSFHGVAPKSTIDKAITPDIILGMPEITPGDNIGAGDILTEEDI